VKNSRGKTATIRAVNQTQKKKLETQIFREESGEKLRGDSGESNGPDDHCGAPNEPGSWYDSDRLSVEGRLARKKGQKAQRAHQLRPLVTKQGRSTEEASTGKKAVATPGMAGERKKKKKKTDVLEGKRRLLRQTNRGEGWAIRLAARKSPLVPGRSGPASTGGVMSPTKGEEETPRAEGTPRCGTLNGDRAQRTSPLEEKKTPVSRGWGKETPGSCHLVKEQTS